MDTSTNYGYQGSHNANQTAATHVAPAAPAGGNDPTADSHNTYNRDGHDFPDSQQYVPQFDAAGNPLIAPQPMFVPGNAAAAAAAAVGTSTTPGNQQQPIQQYPGQPATPRMLRSVSGSMKNSRTDLANPNAGVSRDLNQSFNDAFPSYVAGTPQYNPSDPSHSRNVSLQQQIQYQQQQQLQNIAQRQLQQQQQQQQQQQNIATKVPASSSNNASKRRIRSSSQGAVPSPSNLRSSSSTRPVPPSTPGQAFVESAQYDQSVQAVQQQQHEHQHQQSNLKSELLPPASFSPPVPGSNNQTPNEALSANPSATRHHSNLPQQQQQAQQHAQQHQSSQSQYQSQLDPQKQRAQQQSQQHHQSHRSQSQTHAHGHTHGHAHGHAHGHSQQQQQPPPQQQSSDQKQQQFHRKSIGDWDFVKTIGAGSMGRVKLAQHNTTNELCAVKIVPRAAILYERAHEHDPPSSDAQVIAQRQKEYEKEVIRDKRTIREGALGRLLFHPFICRLYEMVPMTNHYYMLFEYVEGGQLLDYIVSHGCLKEDAARNFARGIASALDYCHRNNVVHRDLKIENIMINQKGDIKLIDFGLSNLYSPKSVLKTYCGSLYFAAPELLSAKPYVGPEVDVWSFAVVIYVLVCGKVPFDDKVVSVLHEKIKVGEVEYPGFISKECVSLLQRMLVVDPLKRASLFEVIQHPWMNKGYEYAVSNYVPKRLPLTLPLDPEIIKTIASFDLGSVQSIANELTYILSSVEYQMSSENWYRITKQGRPYASASNARLLPDPTGGFHPLVSIYYLVDEMRKRKKAKKDAIKAQMRQHSEQRQRRQPSQSQPLPPQKSQPVSQQQPLPQQPFATSSAATPATVAQATSSATPASAPAPRSQAASQTDQQRPPTQEQTASQDHSHPVAPSAKPQQNVPQLAFPEQAHTSTSPATFTRSSQSPPVIPPNEATGTENEDQSTSIIPEQQPHSPRDPGTPETLDPNAGKGSGFNSLLRRLSSKKYKNSPTNSPTKHSTESPNNSDSNVVQPPPLPKVSIIRDSQDRLSPQDSNATMETYGRESTPGSETTAQQYAKQDPMVRRGVSMKVTAKEKQHDSRHNLATSSTSASTNRPEKEKPIKTAQSGSGVKSHNRSSSTSTNKFHGFIPVEYLPPLPNINTSNLVPPGSTGSGSPNPANSERTSGELGAVTTGGRKLHPTARAKSVGHSYYTRNNRGGYSGQGHPPLPNELAAQNSDEGISNNAAREEVSFDDVSLDNVEHQEIPRLSESEIIEQFNHAKSNTMPSIEYPKTLLLKGFFSVQTTSTKPLPVIRYNIINVLSKLGVKFQEVKGGFVCVHTPSLQTQRAIASAPQAEQELTKAPSQEHSTHSHDVSMNSSTADNNTSGVEREEEKKLYGDAFKSTSSSFYNEQQPRPEGTSTPQPPSRIKTPDSTADESGTATSSHYSTPHTSHHQQSKSLSRQPSLHLNTQTLSPSSGNNGKVGGHRSSNSIGGGHRRKFSIGQSILNSYRKKNGSGVHMPPNTPATAKLSKSMYADEEFDDRDMDADAEHQFTEDDSVDSLNGMAIGGGSDMLVSSRIEHRARHQHSPSTSVSPSGGGHGEMVPGNNAASSVSSRKSPLKFEINIVKVPFVGFHGVQFKKILGNTWNYKTLAGQILKEMNL